VNPPSLRKTVRLFAAACLRGPDDAASAESGWRKPSDPPERRRKNAQPIRIPHRLRSRAPVHRAPEDGPWSGLILHLAFPRFGRCPLGKDPASFPRLILPDVDRDVAQSYGLTYPTPAQSSSEICDGRDEPNGERKVVSLPALVALRKASNRIR
jgi:hypothetical protein